MADADAPHGRDAQGVPLAPYGLTVSGRPRKSRAGAPAGSRAKTSPTSSSSTARKGPTAADRRQMLCELSSMLIETPLAAASKVPQVRARIGHGQADALAGDAFLIGQFMPQIADGLIFYGQTNPKALAWLEKLEESGPAVVIAAGLLQLGTAIVKNHINPSPQLAEAGRSSVEVRMLMMAQAVNEQAAAFRAHAETMNGVPAGGRPGDPERTPPRDEFDREPDRTPHGDEFDHEATTEFARV